MSAASRPRPTPVSQHLGHRRARPGRVRIIGGTHRGRLVDVPDAPGLRPTPDRVRETLFNWLGQDLTGASTFEPWAGCGVLTLEARSRGAALCVAIDRDAVVIRALRATALRLGLDAIDARPGDALAALAAETRRFDVIFADPPFADDPWSRFLPLAAARLAPQGRIYAEAGHPIDVPPPLQLVRQARAGGVHYHLLAAAAQRP
ncbi:MAG TPA: RsmD family RNA methyltransferase [Casimicrobiaceae bacterium]